MKLNFDGSAIGNPGVAGIGGIIQNEKGSAILSYLGLAGYCSNNQAELMALNASLHKACSRNQHGLLVKGDPFCVIQWAARLQLLGI